MIRPTVKPSSSTFYLLVFGERGRILIRCLAEYTGEIGQEEYPVEVILSPSRIPRQRRHLAKGTMLQADMVSERRLVDFVSWWKGRWQDDYYHLDPRAELDFLVEGLPRARGAGVRVDVGPGLTDIMSSDRLRVLLDVVAKGSGLLVQSDTLVGDEIVSQFALAEAKRLKRKWVAIRGQVVNVDEAVDLGLLYDSAGQMAFVPWEDKGKLVGALQLIRDSRIEEEYRPLIRRVLASEDEMKPPKAIKANLRSYQSEGMRWLVNALSSGSGGILADSMGTGKAMCVWTPVLTTSGWTEMGQLKKGDLVYGSDGKPHAVTGVFPQGKKKVFKVSFNDGSSTTCCEDHLWAVKTPYAKSRGGPARVLSLKQIMQEGLFQRTEGAGSSNRKHFIPVVSPVELPHADLPMDPYALGALLANGCLRRSVVGYSGSEEQLGHMMSVMPRGVTAVRKNEWNYNIVGDGKSNVVLDILRSLGVQGHLAHDKSVPAIYMTASLEQRKALLQGLMDNDGTIDDRGHCEYNTVSPSLAKNVVELVQSLGGIARVSTRIPKYTHNGEVREGQMDHRISVTLPNNVAPFRIHSKASRVIKKTKYLPSRAFDKVEPAGEEECVCISVDSKDSLFVVENYILTHNTLQAITSYVKMKESDTSYRAIVFAPKSLMGNWQNEFRKFAPSIRVLVWDGPNRSKFKTMIPQVDVVVCSYDTYKRDHHLLNQHPFHAAFFDEAHQLKNPDTANHKAAKSCLAPVRIAMTGTPVENRLSDLHSIFSICCPGLLPPLREFNERIVRPFRAGDPTALQIMADQIKPNVLRRTKEQVLSELPPKTIIDQLCPMTDVQAGFYQEAMEAAREEKKAAMESGNKSELQAVYFRLISRLRRIATDPRMADPMGRYRADDSGKMLTLRGMMDEFDTDDTNKVLIFSQWVDCLELVKLELEERKQKFSYLTGETKNRDQQVEDFQSKDDIRYFLISLKAGGVGLNITKANFVIIMDPWWNPAIENQAIDRAHRFGQQRNVTAYRMISEGTLEQTIAEMKEIKQAISDGVLDGGEFPNQTEVASSLIG